ncbi:MAG TPA: hypothetical protein VF323_07565 [Candidatus Limnocylindrales bacterium]
MTTTAATGTDAVARRIPDSSAEARLSAGRWLDPARTALMVAISGSVLAASLLIASLSAGAVGERTLISGTQPEPEPPPALATPAPEGAQTSP